MPETPHEQPISTGSKMPESTSANQSNIKLSEQTKARHHNAIPNVHPTNSVISSDGKIFKLQKKRQRKIYSCIPCHQRKIKCSRELPTCSNCQKLVEKNPSKGAEIIDACKYFNNDKKKNLRKKGVVFDPNEYDANTGLNSCETSPRESLEHTESADLHKVITSSSTNNENVSHGNNTNRNHSTASGSPLFDNPYADQFEQSQSNFYMNQHNGSVYPIVNNFGTNAYTEQWNNGGDQTEQQHHVIDDFNLSTVRLQEAAAVVPNLNMNRISSTGGVNASPTQADKNKEERSNVQNSTDVSANNKLICSNNESSSFSRNESYQSGSYPDFEVYSYYAKQFASQFRDILGNLPSKSRSDELLQNFKVNIHSLLPILEIEPFLEKYKEFWYCGLFLTDNIEKLYQYFVYFKDKPQDKLPERIGDFLYWYNKTNCTMTPSNFNEFLILLYAIYYSSLSSSVYEFLSEKHDNMNKILSFKYEVNKYYNMFRIMNNKSLNNPRVMSLAVLQINVLVQSIINLKSGKSLINISKILRICQFYQLNRDPVIYHSLTDTTLIQTRRIVWWHIFHLDNMVSFFLNLTPTIKLSDFDTNFLLQNNGSTDVDYDSLFSIMFLNCMYRFTLIVDDLNVLTNGLEYSLNAADINKLKISIKNLSLICKETIKTINRLFLQNLHYRQYNLDGGDSSDNAQENFHNRRMVPDNFRFFIYILNTLPDKILIMLQKKILLKSMMCNEEGSKPNLNLNLKLNRLEYTYDDVESNLLSSLLHYLDNFLFLSKKEMMKYNWKLKNYIPIDELILLMQILACNYKMGLNQNMYDPFQDINLKIYLIDKTMKSFKINWHLKLSSVNKLISLASKLWELMILKYNINLDIAYLLAEKYVIPAPIEGGKDEHRSNSFTSSNNSGSDSKSTDKEQADIEELNLRAVFDLSNKPKFEVTHDDHTNKSQVHLDVKDRFIYIAQTIEDELAKEGASNIIQETDENEEGWYNLGTEEEFGTNSIDDFHFYKNLKSDVIRLFKFIVC